MILKEYMKKNNITLQKASNIIGTSRGSIHRAMIGGYKEEYFLNILKEYNNMINEQTRMDNDKKIIVVDISKRCLPKPRMTRADKWKKRPVVVKFREWKDVIKEAFINEAKKLSNSELKYPIFDKCEMGFYFDMIGNPRCDLDNLIKGIKDSLKDIAFSDDNVRIIPRYITPVQCNILCNSCKEYCKGNNSKKIRGKEILTLDTCKYNEKTVIIIKEL